MTHDFRLRTIAVLFRDFHAFWQIDSVDAIRSWLVDRRADERFEGIGKLHHWMGRLPEKRSNREGSLRTESEHQETDEMAKRVGGEKEVSQPGRAGRGAVPPGG